MRRIGILVVVILIQSWAAQVISTSTCSDVPIYQACINLRGYCDSTTQGCNGTWHTGVNYCAFPENTCSCCAPDDLGTIAPTAAPTAPPCGLSRLACVKRGGNCQDKTDVCYGKILNGKKYCYNSKQCGCCVPIDCSKRTRNPCEALNGTCIGQDEVCHGRVVTGKAFCRSPDSCKCCFPECDLTTFTTGPSGVIFTFINNCTQDIWMGALGQSKSSPSFWYKGIAYFVANNGGWYLPEGATSQVTVPFDFTAGRFWARTGCSGTPTNNDFHCETGDCGPWIECAHDNVPRSGVPPATLAEFTLNANNKDYYDISLVGGFNLPMTIHVVTYDNTESNPNKYWCTSPECLYDINNICPPVLAVNGPSGTVACDSACTKFNTNETCCRGQWGTPKTCNPDKWPINSAKIFKSKCPQAYSYAYDDPTSTFTCRNTNYDIHFC